MTMLVSWLGVDTHGPTSMYIAADSRITWGSTARYDHARKVFAFKNSPDILGYCGDVLFPSMVLSQVTDMADAGILFADDARVSEKFRIVEQLLKALFNKYPHQVAGITTETIEIIHGSRQKHTTDTFRCRVLSWRRGGSWIGRGVTLPEHSDTLFIKGTGSSKFEEKFEVYKRGQNKRTSRSVFHCFCSTLFGITEPTVGGAPQLVGIIRKPNTGGITYGTICGGNRYFLGTEVSDCTNFDRIEWRNDLFEICDGETMQRRPAAQKQDDPNRPTINKEQLPGP